MAVLYVTEQNALLRKKGERLVAVKGKHTLLEVPLIKIEGVLAFGNVQFTTQLANALLARGIELTLLSSTGRLRGQLTPPTAKNVDLRLRQYELSRNTEFCLALARSLVTAKVHSAANLLRRYRANHRHLVDGLAIEELDHAADSASWAPSLESLRGTEGQAAARTFEALARLLPAELGFQGRQRRPPRDPANALLSFGYVLVGSELRSLLEGIGFDPYLGLYHQPDYSHPSLPLDLLEEMRSPVVDRFTLAILRRGHLRAKHFSQHPKRGTRLTRDGQKIYFRALEKEMDREILTEGEELSWRQIYQRQAHRLRRHLLEGEPYQPFVLPS